jgi:hypothetical protein
MGTYFTEGATKKDVVAEILEPLKKGAHLLASHMAREDGEHVLWTVECGAKDGHDYRRICCYLLRTDGCNGSWGYKPLDETVGPCYYSVPRAWLKKYPILMPPGTGTGYSPKWREKVLNRGLSVSAVDA